MTTYDVGDLVGLTNTFYDTDVSGMTPVEAATHAADPTTVTLTIRDPFGDETTVTTPAISNPDTGEYLYPWTPLVGGAHEIIWVGEGDVQAVEPQTIIVRSGLDQALATTEYIQGVLGTTGSGNPDLVARLALVCSEHIMQHCGRRFLPNTGIEGVKNFRARATENVISLAPWDLQVGEDVAVAIGPSGSSQTLTVETDYYLAPENHAWGIADRIVLQNRLPGRVGQTTLVQVTATWGWHAIPPQVAEACAYWVRDLMRGVSGYPQTAQVEDPTAPTADGVVPAVCRQLLAPFRQVVLG